MARKVLLWVSKTGKLCGQATKNPTKLRKFLGLSVATSSVIRLRKSRRV